MIFDVSPDAYYRFIGRYSEPLAAQVADLAGERPRARAAQKLRAVHAGRGAHPPELARGAGPEAISAAEPSASFVAAARDRVPTADIRQARAEGVPVAPGDFEPR